MDYIAAEKKRDFADAQQPNCNVTISRFEGPGVNNKVFFPAPAE